MNPSKSNDVRAVGVGRLKLGQGRFDNGAIYVSAILNGGDLSAVDFRFFLEQEELLTPTRKGFRVYQRELGPLMSLFRQNPEDVGEVTLWSSGSLSLIVRRCDDEYGKGIDFRYYKISTIYKGWEKRGIRFRDEDFAKMSSMVVRTGVMDIGWRPTADLFEGRRFVAYHRGAKEGVGTRNEGRVATAGRQGANLSSTSVSDALAQFLSED